MFLLSLRAFLENPIKLQSRPDHSSLTPHQTDFLPSSVIRCPGISCTYRVISNNAKFSPPVQQSRKTQLGHLAAEREGWSQLYSFYTCALAYKCTLRWSPPNIGVQSKYLFIPSVQCNADWNWCGPGCCCWWFCGSFLSKCRASCRRNGILVLVGIPAHLAR